MAAEVPVAVDVEVLMVSDLVARVPDVAVLRSRAVAVEVAALGATLVLRLRHPLRTRIQRTQVRGR
jgi:hypothetical protein